MPNPYITLRDEIIKGFDRYFKTLESSYKQEFLENQQNQTLALQKSLETYTEKRKQAAEKGEAGISGFDKNIENLKKSLLKHKKNYSDYEDKLARLNEKAKSIIERINLKCEEIEAKPADSATLFNSLVENWRDWNFWMSQHNPDSDENDFGRTIATSIDQKIHALSEEIKLSTEEKKETKEELKTASSSSSSSSSSHSAGTLFSSAKGKEIDPDFIELKEAIMFEYQTLFVGSQSSNAVAFMADQYKVLTTFIESLNGDYEQLKRYWLEVDRKGFMDMCDTLRGIDPKRRDIFPSQIQDPERRKIEPFRAINKINQLIDEIDAKREVESKSTPTPKQ